MSTIWLQITEEETEQELDTNLEEDPGTELSSFHTQ